MGVKVRERDGAWWVFIHHKGRRKAKRIGVGDPGKKAAKAVAEKIQAKLALGDLSALDKDQKPVTFAEYAETWLKVYVEVNCKASTVEEYDKALRLHLLPTFGPMALREITRDRIRLFLAEKLAKGSVQKDGKPLSAGSVGNLLIILRAILFHAVDDGLLTSNPAARLGKFAKRKNEIVSDRLDVFTREELAHLLAVTEREIQEAYPPILTLAKTGIRESELFGLQPDDLDFTKRVLWVRRAISRGRISTPKNRKARRVDLSPQACHVLRDYLTRRDAEAALAGKEPSVWLFPMPNGEPMHVSYFIYRLWYPALDRAGLKRRGPHQLRHSFASLLIAQGAHPKYIQEQLGHSSIQITLDLYGHLFEGDHRRYVEALDHVLAATVRNPDATAIATGTASPVVSGA
jgi:integrase